MNAIKSYADDGDNHDPIDELAKLLAEANFEIGPREYELPVFVKRNSIILKDMLSALKTRTNKYDKWETSYLNSKVFSLIQLEEDGPEYKKIKNLGTDRIANINIIKIERVENPYLLIQYHLKKMKKGCLEETLYHGTKPTSVQDICRENFNWRLAGTSRGHIFGKGVSFSPDFFYSSHYGSTIGGCRVMFVVDVLIKSICQGSPDMIIPTGSADTSMKYNRQVIVKYEDNDFYPNYVIYYS